MKTKLALRSRAVGFHLELSPPDQKAIDFTKRNLQTKVDANDSGQKTAIPSFSGGSYKTAVDSQ